MNEKLDAFKRLLHIMDDLREKCPWDKKQTMQSLRHLTIEETYELTDAILEEDTHEIKKELGDLLLHIVFYAKIASETNDFDMADVINEICEKLIHRHPHIYGDVEVQDEKEVKANWEKLKLKEGKKSVLEGVPKSLPALVKAIRIQDKARGIGFDWDSKEQVFEKVTEEIQELQKEVQSNSTRIEAEFGDVLFSLINYARFLGINPEDALEKTNKKFINRFQHMEEATTKEGKKMSDMTLEEMDKYWDEAKSVFH
ncbi:MAG: nucleoside triphosphate pyrophosphohydrolase [Vicingus serpentipes]|nr:nucleoside triphosphate pyrophosphohydrolase [Vicingus serpentipes]